MNCPQKLQLLKRSALCDNFGHQNVVNSLKIGVNEAIVAVQPDTYHEYAKAFIMIENYDLATSCYNEVFWSQIGLCIFFISSSPARAAERQLICTAASERPEFSNNLTHPKIFSRSFVLDIRYTLLNFAVQQIRKLMLSFVAAFG